MREDKGRRFQNMARGYLEIEISGAHAERLLNLALQQGVELTDIRRYGDTKIAARVLLQDIYRLRPLARASRCRFRIKRRAGLPFVLAKMRRRAALVCGGLIMAIALYIVCTMVWLVEVESPYPLTANHRQEILEIAAQLGLQPGTPAWRLDYEALGKHILAADSQLLYAQVERRGITAYVEVVWRQDVAQEDAPLPPGEIVATADGLIENILVRNGTAAVQAGDTVKKGDILVYGYSGTQLVAASAMIDARVWGSAEAAWPLQEQGRRLTGFKSQGLLLRFGQDGTAPAVWLSGEIAAPYQLSSLSEEVFVPTLWRNMQLPVELVLHTWYEEEEYTTSYTREQALFHAQRRAQTLALAKLPDVCRIQRQQSRELGQSADQVLIQYSVEALADISAFQEMDETRLAQYRLMLSGLAYQQKQEGE